MSLITHIDHFTRIKVYVNNYDTYGLFMRIISSEQYSHHLMSRADRNPWLTKMYSHSHSHIHLIEKPLQLYSSD